MANTSIQHKVEDWVRNKWLVDIFGEHFQPEKLKLSAGGYFEFDAVNITKTIVINISTSKSITSSGKQAVGKIHKLHSDILFLQMAETTRRIMLLTEKDMYLFCQKEQNNGRVPQNIEFLHAEIPEKLNDELKLSREIASLEVKPRKT